MDKIRLLLQVSLSLILLGGGITLAQTETPPKLYVNGLGRALINAAELGGTMAEGDTTTAKNTLDGEFLLDLKINASPNEKTEVQSILRLRNEFGGFFGSGMSIEVRELFARGVVADVLRYHVGDMDLVKSPFTLYQYDTEGSVNEAAIFQGRKEVIDYEQFFTENNTRRMQGIKLEMGLTVNSLIPEVNLDGFFTRVRGTDFFTLPSRYVGGGSIELVNRRWGKLTGNYVNTFDIRSIGNFATGIQNPVQSLQLELNILNEEKYSLGLKGEAGLSRITELTDSTESFDKSDSFFEGKLEFELKPQNLTFTLGVRNIGPDFFSIAAQSKRVDFGRQKAFFNRFGNEQMVRNTSLFDLNRDRSLYTYALSDVLMPYDPRYANAMPYGRATANRRGIWLGLDHGSEESAFEGGLEFNLMQEIRGQGTFELKTFNLLRIHENIHIHKLIDREEAITITLGYQLEQTRRGGVDVEQVNLNTNLLDAGLQIELFDNFDLLFGAKILTANGSDYVADIIRYNVVRDFPPRTEYDDNETLLAAGIRYRFKEGIYLSIQWDRFSFSRASNPDLDYRIDQPFILYNMNF